jgi:hypothetical protein
MFHYEALEADINDVPANGFYETHPEVDPSSTSPMKKFGLSGTVAATASALMPKVALPEKQAAEVERLLDQARYEAHSRGIVLLQYITQYDHQHRGVVTTSQFIREFLNYFRTFSVDDVHLLASAYSNDHGEVMYMAACRDITPEVFHSQRDQRLTINNHELGTLPSSHVHKEAGPRKASPNAKLSRSLALTASADEITRLLAAVIRVVHVKRINIHNIFADFDKLSNHRITRPQFVRALASLNVEGVAPHELEALANNFVDPADASGNMVKYRDFVQEVNNAFTLSGLEKNPLRVNDTFAQSVITGPTPRSSRPELTKEEDNFLQLAIGDIKNTIVRIRAFNVGAGLRDFDVRSEGFITVERFMRVLAMNKLVPETPGERMAVLKYYRGTGMRDNMVNYRAFLDDIGLA